MIELKELQARLADYHHNLGALTDEDLVALREALHELQDRRDFTSEAQSYATPQPKQTASTWHPLYPERG